jgi:hypothetical protein
MQLIFELTCVYTYTVFNDMDDLPAFGAIPVRLHYATTLSIAEVDGIESSSTPRNARENER